jgi:hypothetical protein
VSAVAQATAPIRSHRSGRLAVAARAGLVLVAAALTLVAAVMVAVARGTIATDPPAR